MPGMLLRGVVRTAAVAGTATAVSNRVSRRQAERWARQGDVAYGAPVAAPPAAAQRSTVDELKELAALHEQGALTDAEFASEKAKVLGT